MAVVSTDVLIADVVAHDDEDVRLLLLWLRRRWLDHGGRERRQQSEADAPARTMPHSLFCFLGADAPGGIRILKSWSDDRS